MPQAPIQTKPFVAEEFLAELESLGETTVHIKLARNDWPLGSHRNNLAEQFVAAKKTAREQTNQKHQIAVLEKAAKQAERSAKEAEQANIMAEEALQMAKSAETKAIVNLIGTAIVAFVAVLALWK